MKKVIVKGDPNHKPEPKEHLYVVCPKCGCEFECDSRDVEYYYDEPDGLIFCPTCKYGINKKTNSRHI